MAVMQSGLPIINVEDPPLPHVNGSLLYLLTTRVPLRDENGNVIGVAGLSVDISERKRAEIELQKSKAALETANAQLLKANEIIRSKDIAQTKFVQNMQHDFRTPSTGAWSMLVQLAESEKNLERKKKLELVRDANKRICEICDEIIDFDKIDRAEIPITLKKFSLGTLINNVLELHNPAALMKGLILESTVDLNIPKIVKGDQNRISRILANLVSNAIKFTNVGGVDIKASLAKKSGNRVIVQIAVHDSGIGIPKDKQDSIFEKFNRLTPSNEGYYKGSGLGLNIVKRFIEEIDGEIDVTCEEGMGTTFLITFPLTIPLLDEKYDDQKGDSTDNELLQGNVNETLTEDFLVLLIEDDKLAQMVTLDYLASIPNVKPSVSATVADSLEILRKIKFDLVISDLGLPDGNGNNIIKEIRNSPTSLNYQTPFVALSAHSDLENITQAKQAGFSYVFKKPLEKDKIRLLILHFYHEQPT